MPGVAKAPDHMAALNDLLTRSLRLANKPRNTLEKSNFSTRLDAPLKIQLRDSEIVTVPVGVEVLYWQGKDLSFCTIFDYPNRRLISVRRSGTVRSQTITNYNGTPAS